MEENKIRTALDIEPFDDDPYEISFNSVRDLERLQSRFDIPDSEIEEFAEQLKDVQARGKIVEFKTSNPNTFGVLDYTLSLAGSWPGIVMRYYIKMKVRVQNGVTWRLDGCDFWFHNFHHKANITVSGGTVGPFLETTIDIPWSIHNTAGSPSQNPRPGVGITTPAWSGSTTLSDNVSIPQPTNYSVTGISSITSSSATVNAEFGTRYGFWRYRIVNNQNKTWTPTNDMQSSSTRLTGLSSSTRYTVYVQVIDRNGKEVARSSGKSFTTSGGGSGGGGGGTVTPPTPSVTYLTVYTKRNGQLVRANVYVKHQGQIKQVREAWVKQNGILKKVVNV